MASARPRTPLGRRGLAATSARSRQKSDGNSRSARTRGVLGFWATPPSSRGRSDQGGVAPTSSRNRTGTGRRRTLSTRTSSSSGRPSISRSRGTLVPACISSAKKASTAASSEAKVAPDAVEDPLLELAARGRGLVARGEVALGLVQGLASLGEDGGDVDRDGGVARDDVVEARLVEREEVHVGGGHHGGGAPLPREQGHLPEELSLHQPGQAAAHAPHLLRHLHLPAVHHEE